MTIWVTSDTHFSHRNILNFLGPTGAKVRPGFLSVEEMDDTLVERWNTVVKPGDHVYHLGDVTMIDPYKIAPLLDRLTGKLRLVRGNHDIFDTRKYLRWFDEVYGCRVLENLLFTHIPVHPESLGRFRANIHGHIHDRPAYPAVKQESGRYVPYVNVCVEQTGYRPLALEEVQQLVVEATPRGEEV